MRGLAVVAVAGVVGELSWKTKPLLVFFCFYFYYLFLFLFFIGLLDFRKIAKSVSALTQVSASGMGPCGLGCEINCQFSPNENRIADSGHPLDLAALISST
jgi:hypothetical protein